MQMKKKVTKFYYYSYTTFKKLNYLVFRIILIQNT